MTQHQPTRGRPAIGGTQTYVATIGDELGRRGREVYVRGLPNLGRQSQPRSDFYDLAIVSQNSTFDAARPLAKRVIFVSHGIGELEQPPAGADGYAFVSEECFQHWHNRGDWAERGKLVNVIRQPIDTDRFKPDPDAEPNIDVLRVSTYGGLERLPGLCDEIGLSFHHARDEPPPNMPGLLNRARVVVAVGRSALEAMAARRPVILADDRPYSGGALLDTEYPITTMLANYSGRGGREATPERLRKAILDAWFLRSLTDRWEVIRQHVVDCHDVAKITDQLLELAEA